MRILVFALLLCLCGCAGTGGWPPHRTPDQSFTVIHSPQGSTSVYRQGGAYWMNGNSALIRYASAPEGLTVIHTPQGSTTIYRNGNTLWVNDGRKRRD